MSSSRRRPAVPSSLEHISGVSVSETIPLAKMATMIVIANSRKMRPTSPVMNTSGINTAASEIVMARIVKLISLAEFSVASSALCPVLHQPHRVFQKHDGVIHQEPDRQRECHQREVIQAVAQNVHHQEGQQQR